jgi:hypothetical protein
MGAVLGLPDLSGRWQLLLTSFEGRTIFVDEVRMGLQADSERVPGSGRKRKLLSMSA